MKYFIDSNTRGREVLQHMKEIECREDMIEFIHDYQTFLNTLEGNPAYDRRVIERTIYYMLGFMTGFGIKHENQKVDDWKAVINQELYSKGEDNKVTEHRLLEL